MKKSSRTHVRIEAERYDVPDAITIPTICSRIVYIEEIVEADPTCLVCQRVLGARKKGKV